MPNLHVPSTPGEVVCSGEAFIDFDYFNEQSNNSQVLQCRGRNIRPYMNFKKCSARLANFLYIKVLNLAILLVVIYMKLLTVIFPYI